jgi:hypothetical protein
MPARNRMAGPSTRQNREPAIHPSDEPIMEIFFLKGS